MREILFRGKKDPRNYVGCNNEWVYGSLVHQIDYYGDKVDKYFIIDGTTTQDYDIGFEYRVMKESVGQYTGYKDAYGVDVFEGDLVSVDDSEDYGEVVWDDNDARFIIEFSTYAITFYGVYNWEVKVIGNIHDNPELTEG